MDRNCYAWVKLEWFRQVRLVRACGSKRKPRCRGTDRSRVRLVRACGSKPPSSTSPTPTSSGQARKSLWIETTIRRWVRRWYIMVRLVRACGSKHLVVGTNKRASEVRLVRACGSKRKLRCRGTDRSSGQARKSLWIETNSRGDTNTLHKVRLVRACGSKLP